MLEFYPPAPGSFNRQGESGQPLPTVPPIPFRPTTDNNNAAGYIGQTKRQLKVRINEHRSDIKKHQDNWSVVSRHRMENGHTFDWSNVAVRHQEKHLRKREMAEMLFIKRSSNAINLQKDTDSLPEPSVSVKTESGLLETICAGCGRTIADKYMMRVAERNYHEECLSCTACGAMLSHSCFIRDLKLYCRTDYERIFGVKCARCLEKVSNSDLVMRPVSGLVFHVECFACCMCGQPLPRGAHYVLRQGQPICRRDFEREMYLNSPQDDDLLDENRPRDGRRGPKRPRTILTSAQRRQFKMSFEVSPKPCRKVREALAKDTGLSVRVVQVWFQNQRAKMKKLQRKAKTEPGSDKEPKEERRAESPHSDHSHYLNAMNMRDGESSSFPSATQPLNPNNPYSPDDAYPGHSGESFCSSDLSLDGTDGGFDIGENDGGGADGSHQGASHSHHGSSSHDAPSLSQSLHAAIHNPIDKLFMMQSSYFSGDHA